MKRHFVLGILILTVAMRSAFAQEKAPIKNLILPGESFLIEGRPAFIMWPEESKRRDPQPWIMYGPTLSAYPDQAEKWMHQQFLDAGIAVAGIDVGEAHGSPFSQNKFTALYEELTQNRGFAKKPCLLGRSRGGLWASSWAVRNTDKVAGLAGIYPVYDLTAYPGLKRAASAYKMTEQELQAALPEHNPIAKIDALAAAKIPVCIIHGDNDTVVPLKENSFTLKLRYEAAGVGELVNLMVPSGQGHNFWPGFFHCQEIVDFTVHRAKVGAGLKSKSPAKNPHHMTLKDIEYHKVDGKSLLLDVYRPRNVSGQVPVVMWVHGGGWKNGSKDRCPATWLTEHGFAVVSVNYRLTDEAQWPAQIEDLRAAVHWIRMEPRAYGFDPLNIGVWGGSAGGHLVALMGTLPLPEKEEPISSKIQAVCDWYGPSDLLTMPPNTIGNGRTAEDVAKSNGAKLLGKPIPDVPELAKQASALHQVSWNDAPFLIMHGEKDPAVPLSQSQQLHEKLTAAGVSSELHIIPNAGHGGKEFRTPEVNAIVLKFFKRTLTHSVSKQPE